MSDRPQPPAEFVEHIRSEGLDPDRCRWFATMDPRRWNLYSFQLGRGLTVMTRDASIVSPEDQLGLAEWGREEAAYHAAKGEVPWAKDQSGPHGGAKSTATIRFSTRAPRLASNRTR